MCNWFYGHQSRGVLGRNRIGSNETKQAEDDDNIMCLARITEIGLTWVMKATIRCDAYHITWGLVELLIQALFARRK